MAEKSEFYRTPYNHMKGSIYFEYSIPRMGKRIDVVLLIGSAIFVLEFKVGEKEFSSYAIDQVWDYSLDLKISSMRQVTNVLLPQYLSPLRQRQSPQRSLQHHITTSCFYLIKCNEELLSQVIGDVLRFVDGSEIDPTQWESGRYQPTPSIIEAAMAFV
ncbi:MAG: hypothetical protein MZV64_00340 [Ignavibacteriales bacterium]|nr:hypothetical protein [Ignavibacteriales bacterium]